MGSCSGNGENHPHGIVGDTLTTRAELLTLVRTDEGIVAAEISNPWDSSKPLSKLLFVDRGIDEKNVSVPPGYTVVRTPVSSALVYSGVHASAFDELGAAGIITGVADSEYFFSKHIRDEVASGKIVDVGNSLSPSLEKIIELSPEIALLSPYENAGHGVLDNSGTTVVDMADYMESTPLGRAEWILLIGCLADKFDEAAAIYSQVVKDYSEITNNIDSDKKRPLVVTELPSNGTWFQPGGKSYMTCLIEDAGGTTVTAGDTSAGSVQYAIANVYEAGADADIWLIKSYGNLSANDIAAINPLAHKFKPFRTGNIWIVDTANSPFFEVIAFHPERVLRDFSIIFGNHKEGNTEFYKRL